MADQKLWWFGWGLVVFSLWVTEVKHSVSSSPGAEPEPEEPRGPSRHTATEPPSGQHTAWEKLIPYRTCRTCEARYTPKEIQETSEPAECTTDVTEPERWKQENLFWEPVIPKVSGSVGPVQCVQLEILKNRHSWGASGSSWTEKTFLSWTKKLKPREPSMRRVSFPILTREEV